MSGKPRLDSRSKLGRALFQLVDASLKLPNDVRTIVIRVRNVIEADPEDKMMRFSLRGDLDVLGRNATTAAASQASVRVLPPTSAGALGEVYFRPPESYMEPATLLAVLRRRLGIVETPPASALQNTPTAPPPGGLKTTRRPPPPPGTRAKRV